MISIVIPTLDRPQFVVRQLRYLAQAGFKCKVLIGDGSEESVAAPLRAEVAKIGDRLAVAYHEWPGLSDIATLKRLAQSIDTPYAAYAGDDDFLVPGAIARCIAFLEQSPAYVAANGRGYAFEIGGEGLYGNVILRDRYALPLLESERAAERVRVHLEHYSVGLFSVHRTEAWQRMWRDVDEDGDRSFMAELIPCCLAPALGKIGQVDCTYVFRQSHPQRYLLPRAQQWAAGPKWAASREKFLQLVAAEIAARDSIAPAQARRGVEEAFQVFLRRFAALDKHGPLRAALSAPLRALRRSARAGELRREVDAAGASEPDVSLLLRILEHPAH